MVEEEQKKCQKRGRPFFCDAVPAQTAAIVLGTEAFCLMSVPLFELPSDQQLRQRHPCEVQNLLALTAVILVESAIVLC
jgi:hypothetical protein